MDPVVAKLQALVRIATVSRRPPQEPDHAAFDRFLAELAHQFPLVHERLELTLVGGHGLLVRWAGAGNDRPVVLMAHLDVVPAEQAGWTLPPFGGDIADGAVWGRGTLDDKGSLVAICEAVERLLGEGFAPAQDVWLSFGCDEEVTGASAQAAVAALRERGVRPWFVLDEGGAIAHESLPGVSAPLGVVGVAEKGSSTLELVATGAGGHSSVPTPRGPAARLAMAIIRLDHAAMAAHLPKPTMELFARVAPRAGLPLRAVLTRAHSLTPALLRVLPRLGPEAAALVRTTFAVTTLHGSEAHNVLADTARAGVNARIMPGDTVASATEFVRRTVGRGVEVHVVDASEPSPVSPTDDAFELVEGVIGEVFPDAIATPYVVMGATDARFFTAICDRVYRFTPFRMSRDQRLAIHGADEHLMIADLLDGVRWYELLLRRLPR